jgi:hypothetical protein
VVNLIWVTNYNNGSVPGNHLEGSFRWKAHIELLDLYKAMGKYIIGDGKSIYIFFGQIYGVNNVYYKKFPHPVTFARKTNATFHDTTQTEFL